MNQYHSSQLYNAMLENMQDGFLHCRAIDDSEGKSLDFEIIEINKSLRELIQVQEDIRHKKFSEVLSMNSSIFFYFAILTERLKNIKAEESFEFNNSSVNKWYSISIFPELDKQYLILIKDITKQKIYSDQERYYNAAMDLLCVMDFSGNIIKHNDAWEKMLGYTRQELKSQNLWELLYDREKKQISCIDQETLANKKVLGFEAQCVRKTEDYIWLQIYIYPDAEKKLVYTAARDITVRKNMEEQLRESEERWQFALEGSEAGVWDWNIETNEQIYSKGWKMMLGYEEHELQSNIQEWISRIHPDDIEHAKQLTYDYLNGVIPAYNNEHRLRCKDGSYKWILSRAKIVKRSPEGKPLRMTGTHTDITELKSLLEELTELTNDYEIVFNGTQDALFLVSVDDDGELRYNRLNSSHERLTGLKTEQIKGKTPQEVVGKKQGKKVEAHYKRCVRKKGVIRYEEQMELPTGNKIWYTRLSPVIRDGRVVYIVGSSRDITEQKSLEEYKKKVNDEIRILNESIAYENLKTEFFSNLSHELRTPLNVILCSVQLTNLLIDNSGNQKLKESITRYMKIMKQNSFRLLRLVNNIIDITKIDSGYAGLALENTDIVGLVKDIVMSIEAYVQNKSIKLSFNSQIKQRIIAIDMDKIERIILNLLSNAVKFTEAEGKIDVKLFEENDSVFISVKDNGIGIPENKQEVIFDRFVQIDKSLTRRQEGSGIGLALVKTMVELHKGKISVKSTLGQGSEFIVSLPIYRIDDKEIVDYSQSKAERDIRELISMEFSDIYS